jgi:hypothetical protein
LAKITSQVAPHKALVIAEAPGCSVRSACSKAANVSAGRSSRPASTAASEPVEEPVAHPGRRGTARLLHADLSVSVLLVGDPCGTKSAPSV